MGKNTFFVCQQCGAKTLKWVGKCPQCGAWNSMIETTETPSPLREKPQKPVIPLSLSQIKSFKKTRILTGIEEFDRVLGGGIVPGSMILLAGEPGIGKSTILLQIIQAVSRRFKSEKTKALYISGEESLQQIKIRAERLGVKSDKIMILAETDVEEITSCLRNDDYQLVIVDSIQTLYTPQLTSVAGSISQVRECSNYLIKIAKNKDIPIFLVSHVTKEGVIAGPKVLEHMVDTVVYLEGERTSSARLLRVTKNRFGATDEVGIFEMTDKGMVAVDNPSELFLGKQGGKVPGSVVTVTIEGTRPLLVEIQGLVVPTQLAIPRRVGQGVDYGRLQMIIAVLTKILRLPLGGVDIYVNVAGGLRIEEPAVDLAIALAIYSSFRNFSLPPYSACWGELGLLGEIRQISGEEKRQKEARRLKFSNIISPAKFSSIIQLVKSLPQK